MLWATSEVAAEMVSRDHAVKLFSQAPGFYTRCSRMIVDFSVATQNDGGDESNGDFQTECMIKLCCDYSPINSFQRQNDISAPH